MRNRKLATQPLEYACPNDDQLYAAMNRISLVLSIMLRYGTTKIQLHACKALVGFGGDHTTINRINTNDIKLIYPRSFIVCFESTFTVLSTIVKQSRETTVAKNTSHYQRSISLNKSLVFLLWSNLVSLSTISSKNSNDYSDLNMAKTIIAHFIDDLLEWLLMTKTAFVASEVALITNLQFSLTPVINTSTEIIGLPVSVEKLIFDIAQRIWVIVQALPSNDDSSAEVNSTLRLGLTENAMTKLLSFIKESNPAPSPTKSNKDNDEDEDEI